MQEPCPRGNTAGLRSELSACALEAGLGPGAARGPPGLRTRWPWLLRALAASLHSPAVRWRAGGCELPALGVGVPASRPDKDLQGPEPRLRLSVLFLLAVSPPPKAGPHTQEALVVLVGAGSQRPGPELGGGSRVEDRARC